ncbi:MAG: single-stranded DNA-binding protein [Parafilimonas sp.]|nr:single-stranded DNA-binding protein [Parafilimonas sp.]
MIKLMVIGNLGKDCLVNTVNGKNVINFNVAHTEKFKDSSGAQREKTTWVECAYWTDRTGISPYLKKGTQVYVEGTPEVRTYQTNDGKNGAALSLRVQTIQLLGSRGEGLGTPQQERSYGNSNGNTYSGQQSNAPAQDDINDASDDLPF